MRAFAAAVILGAVLAATAGAAPPVVMTLTATPSSVAYGGKVTLAGQLSTKQPNQQIGIQATPCGSTKRSKAGNVRTGADGTFTLSVDPAVGTSYAGSYKNGMSPVVPVTVKPVLELTRVARGSFTAKATAGQALTGKFVLFQRYAKLRKRWVQVKRLALGPAVAGPTKPTMVSSVSFKAKLLRGTRVRMMITAAQAGPCYAAALSKTIRA